MHPPHLPGTPHVLIAPDSFKGSLRAADVAAAIAEGVREGWPEAAVHCLPLADGGEGTLDALAALPHTRHSTPTLDLTGRPSTAPWLMLDDRTAVLESATVLGLAQAGDVPVAARHSTGLGRLLRAVLDARPRAIWVGLGGTGVNDGGAGFLRALGAELRDATGQAIAADASGLAQLASVSLAGLDPRLADTPLYALADVSSPLCGPSGATHVFGPQKGVPPHALAQFDGWLARLAARAAAAGAPDDCMHHPGAGAAGGLGWAMLILGARILPGAQTVMQALHLDQTLAAADWVITGEGRSDAQTLLGKLPWQVANAARQRCVPVSLIAGDVDPRARPALEAVLDEVVALCAHTTRERAINEAADWLQRVAATLAARRRASWRSDPTTTKLR
jgi:glycerate kinase